jgi:hypothetical protein
MYLYTLLPFPDERKKHNLEIAMCAALSTGLYNAESTEYFHKNWYESCDTRAECLLTIIENNNNTNSGGDDNNNNNNNNNMVDARSCEMGQHQAPVTH